MLKENSMKQNNTKEVLIVFTDGRELSTQDFEAINTFKEYVQSEFAVKEKI